jgi:hypothetical protein
MGVAECLVAMQAVTPLSTCYATARAVTGVRAIADSMKFVAQ